MRHQRSSTTAASRVSYDRYPSAPDGRGATSVPPRAKPVGKDPLAVGEGVNDTAASQEYLKAKRKHLKRIAAEAPVKVITPSGRYSVLKRPRG